MLTVIKYIVIGTIFILTGVKNTQNKETLIDRFYSSVISITLIALLLQ